MRGQMRRNEDMANFDADAVQSNTRSLCDPSVTWKPHYALMSVLPSVRSSRACM